MSKGSGTSRCRRPAGSRGRSVTRTRGRRRSSARTTSSCSGAAPTPTTCTATRARAPVAAVSDRRHDALVRRLHPRHPPQLHAHGGLGHDRRARARTTSGWVRATTSRSSSVARATSPTASRSPTARCRCRSASTTSTGNRVEPATFTIECLDGDDPPAAFTADDLRFGLTEAATHLHRSLTYWNRYMLDARAGQTDNEFAGGYDVPRGPRRRELCVLLLRPRARRGVGGRLRHPGQSLLELPPLQPRVVGGVGVRHSASPASTTRRRASATTTGFASSSPTRIRASPTGSTPRAGVRRCSPCGGSGRSAIRRHRRPGW